MPNLSISLPINSLETKSISIANGGNYIIEGKLTLPTLSEGAPANSQVVCVVQVNGSPIYTGNAGAEGFKVPALLANNDVVSIITSSAALVDQDVNVVKGVVTIS